MNVRLMTFNVQHCLNFHTRRIDFDAVAEQISASGADATGLQEIRGSGPTGGYEDQTGILAGKTGCCGIFGEAIRFNGADPYGNALLSRYPVLKADVVPIPDPDPRRYNGYYETRCVLRAELGVPGGLTLLVTHFGLNPDEHESAVRTVLSLLPEKRCALMGDLNVRPDDGILDPVRAVLTDTARFFPEWESGMTFPSDRPDRKIDYIFVTRDIKVAGAFVPAAAVSDHRPLVADLILD